MSTPEEQAARQKLEALQNHGSNEEDVAKIESAGNKANTAVSTATMGYGAISAFGTGGIGGVACYAAPLAAGIAGMMAGAALVDYFALDEKLLDLLGKPELAKPGPKPATVGHAIAHSSPFAGALGGLLAGVAAGALCAAAAVAIVGTGGLAAPALIVGIAAGASAGLGFGFVHSLVNGVFSKAATVTGQIIEGSPNVFFEGRPVARVTDRVMCSKDSPPSRIAEGSETIFINGLPLARIGHRTTCGATIQEGCTTIFADNTTAQYGPIDSQMSAWQQAIVSIAEVGLSFSAIRFRSSKLGKLIFGEPIDPSDGSYVDFRTDFEYPGILPLKLTRVYSGADKVEGVLGNKWICNWSQRLLYDTEDSTVNLEDGDGEILQFALGKRTRFSARNLKAPHYHLEGTRQKAWLFDSRSQQTLIFATTGDNLRIGRLEAIEDRNKNRIDFNYTNGKLDRVVNSDGQAFIVASEDNGRIRTVTREGDRRPVVRYDYDGNGALTDAESLFNGKFHYTYTKEGWLNHWRDGGHTSVDIEYDSKGRVIATHTPEALYNDRFIYNPDERKTEYLDATGGRTIIWFNENNLPIRQQNPLGNVTLNEWDGLDRKLTTTDPLGRVTRFDYDSFGNLVGEIDWAGRITRINYDAYGQPLQIEYHDGTSAVWVYDDRGNLIEAREPDGSILRYSYDDNGRIIYETSPNGASNRLSYDKHGNISSIRNTLGETTDYDMDHWDRPRAINDPAGHTTRFEYDLSADNPRADVSRIIHPDGGEERFSYDQEGLVVTHAAQEGQTTRYSHGAFDLLCSITDPKGYTTKLDYDGAARLKRVTNAQRQTWSYSYDLAGNLAKETDWAGRETSYLRDAIGRVITKRLPDGVEQHIVWDDLDRIVAVETARQRIAYEYDQADRLVRAATFSKDQPEPESELQFIYDGKGRLTKEIQNGIDIAYRYGLSGRCISRRSPSGETSYGYDLLDQLKTLESNGHVLDFTRDSRGLETRRQYRGEGKAPIDAFTLRQSYDPCGRLTSQLAGRERQLTTHERLAEVSRRYRLDKSGRLIGLSDNKRGGSLFHYDPRDQVTSIIQYTGLNKQREAKYSYDELLNLAHSDGQSHRYFDGTVRAIGRSSYHYDVRGRVIEKKVDRDGFRPKTWRYVWDDFDRLVETRTPDGSVWRYTYDAFGRRFRKVCVKAGESGRLQRFSYLWQGATLAEEYKTINGATEVERWHFEPGTFNLLAKETITPGVGAEKAGEPRFYPIVTDHLGTPKEIFDTNGECLWQAEHELWGKATVKQQKTRPGSHLPLVDCSLRFQNQWEDEETGLFYNLNRYYDPDSGQYLSSDPIGLEGGLRTHGYVHDPMQWVDPWGLAGCPKKAIVVGEGMGRVNKAVKDLRSQGISVKKYQTWSKNWPNGRRLTPSEEAAAIARNKRWIKSKIKQGYDIYDIGPDGRAIPSPFYRIEQEAIITNGYPTIKLPGY